MLSVYLLLILMINLWAFSFIVVDLSVQYISPLAVAFYRFLIASLSYLLLDLYFRFRKKNNDNTTNPQIEKSVFSRNEWVLIILAAQFGVVLFFFTQYTAILLIGPSLPALFVCLLSPIFIVIFSLYFFKEKLNLLKSIGFLIATFGGFFLVTGGDINTLDPDSPNFLGILFALLTPLFWAIYTILTKKLMKTHSTNKILKIIAYIGTVELFLILLFNGELINFLLNAFNWIVIACALYLGLACYTLGYFIWQDSQRSLNSSNVASFLYVEPFITLIFSYIFQVKETILIGNIIGGIIVLIAVVLINYK